MGKEAFAKTFVVLKIPCAVWYPDIYIHIYSFADAADQIHAGICYAYCAGDLGKVLFIYLFLAFKGV